MRVRSLVCLSGRINQVLINSFFKGKVDQRYEVLVRLSAHLEEAGVPYQLVGGMATYSHVNRVDPVEARMTRDVDICVRREDLGKIAEHAGKHGF